VIYVRQQDDLDRWKIKTRRYLSSQLRPQLPRNFQERKPHIMRLINTKTLQLSNFFDGDTPPYAILSHTWGGEEVTLREMQSEVQPTYKKGYKMIELCCLLAVKENLSYAWVDTCCNEPVTSASTNPAVQN
jgi:hypothetical protein